MGSGWQGSPWLTGLVLGAAWTVGSVGIGVVGSDESFGQELRVAAFGGLVFGALSGPLGAAQYRRYRAAAGTVPPVVGDAAVRALRRGEVPGDPVARRAALALTEYAYREAVRGRAGLVGLVGLCTVLALVLAAVSSLWWLLGAVASGVTLVRGGAGPGAVGAAGGAAA